MGSFWRPFGQFLETLWAVFETFWDNFRPGFGDLLGSFGGTFVVTLGQFWGNLWTVFRDLFGSFWRPFEVTLAGLPQLSKLKSSQNKGKKAIEFQPFGHKFAEYGDCFPAFPVKISQKKDLIIASVIMKLKQILKN